MPIFGSDFLLILFHHLVRSVFTCTKLEVGKVYKGNYMHLSGFINVFFVA